MSSKLLKRQFARLHSEDADHQPKGGVTKRSSGIESASRKTKKVLEAPARGKQAPAGKEIAQRNLEYFSATKGTQAATLELMNKVRNPLVRRRWGAGCRARGLGGVGAAECACRCSTAAAASGPLTHPPPLPAAARAAIHGGDGIGRRRLLRHLKGHTAAAVEGRGTFRMLRLRHSSGAGARAAGAGGAPAPAPAPAGRPLAKRPRRAGAAEPAQAAGLTSPLERRGRQRLCPCRGHPNDTILHPCRDSSHDSTRRRSGVQGTAAAATAAAAVAAAAAASGRALRGSSGVPAAPGWGGAAPRRRAAVAAAAAAANDPGGANALAGLFMAYAAQVQEQMQQQSAAAALPGAHVRAEGVSFHPPGAEAPLLDGVTFDLQSNQLGLVIGRSGSGKTTLLQLLAGLSEQTAGDIFISRQPLPLPGGNGAPGAPPTHIEQRMQQVRRCSAEGAGGARCQASGRAVASCHR
jgi:hypothetical protein